MSNYSYLKHRGESFARIARRILLAFAVIALPIIGSHVAIADTPAPSSGEVTTESASGEEQLTGNRPGDLREDNQLEMKLVWCPPGTFTMGAQPDEDVYRTNEGQVTVTHSHGFWIGKYEVTQSEWKAVMESNPSEFSPTGTGKYKVLGKVTTRFPVEGVLVEDAEEFCRRLTDRERQAGRLPGDWTYTLPTEAQWEYACRAGTTTATAFGDQLGSVDANFKGFVPYNGAKRGPFLFRTTNVGSYRGNAWGIHDMHGNVWEYCAGWYTDEARGGSDPEPATSGTYRIGKGGSWFHDGRYSRSAFRYWIEPEMRQGTVGFRVALTEIE